MENGPIPSRLTLLSDLGRVAPASKVRFLGCKCTHHTTLSAPDFKSIFNAKWIIFSVTKYSDSEAIITLEHNHPPGNALSVSVDVTLLLETMKSTDCQIGSWINVTGYVKNTQQYFRTTSGKIVVEVQAIILWLAGPLKIDHYEKTLDLLRAEN